SAAAFVSAADNVATYRIPAPGGFWNESDNGTYTVAQNASQVRDTAGNAHPAGTIGTFVADTVLPAPDAPANPSPAPAGIINALPITLDWDDSANASAYDIYLGDPGTLFETLTSSQRSNFTPPVGDGTQYWRVVAKNADRATAGAQWSFVVDTTPPTAAPGGETPAAAAANLDFTVTYADATTAVDTST